MAYKLEKQKTGSTPYILIDEEKSYMRFEGESFHENVIEFYDDVDSWLTGYMATEFKPFTFDCELVYLNSSTTKLLYNMLTLMDESAVGGKRITVNWITTADNDIIIECGEDLKEDVTNLAFNIVIK